ncbi:RNA 2'-phosphotransferase, partial [Streptomyces gelaticus]
MDERRTVKVSKYLSKHLRHQPERLGITLDANGWVPIDTLLGGRGRHKITHPPPQRDQRGAPPHKPPQAREKQP